MRRSYFFSLQSLKECVECLAWEGSQNEKSCPQSEGRCEGSEGCPPCEEGRRCEEECPHGWQYSEALLAAIPPHWVNCTHKNDSYCQYRWGTTVQISILDSSISVLCQSSVSLLSHSGYHPGFGNGVDWRALVEEMVHLKNSFALKCAKYPSMPEKCILKRISCIFHSYKEYFA